MPEDYPTAFSTPPVETSAQAPMPNQSQRKPGKSVVILLTATLLFSLAAFGYILWRYQMLKSESQITTQPPISTSTAVQDKPTAEKAETEIKRTAEDKNKYIYQIGNFELKIDRDYVYSEFDSKVAGSNSLKQSQIHPDDARYCPVLAGGVFTLWLERKYPDLERPVFGGNPLLIFEYWNPNRIVYLDERAEAEIKERLQNFIDLFSYTDSAELLEKVISIYNSDYSTLEHLYFRNQVIVDPWGGTGVNGCGANFSYPILIKKIPSQKYDKVFFVEAFEGNDSSSPIMPRKKLLINKGEGWLLILEQNRFEEFAKFQEQAEQIASCPHGESEEWLRCNGQLWRENFRDDNANQQWVEKILGFVTYTGNN